MGLVVDIENFGAEFQRARFTERREPEVAQQREIRISVTVAAQRVAPDAAELPWRRRDEGRQVEGETARYILKRVAHLIRTAIRRAGDRIERAGRHRERLARLIRRDAVRLPVADQRQDQRARVTEKPSAATDGERPGRTQHETMRDVEIRQAALRPQVVGVLRQVIRARTDAAHVVN